MATTPVLFRYNAGQALSATLFPYGSDTLAATVPLTEQTNRKGLYRGTVTAALAGWHTAHLTLGSVVVSVVDLWLNDDTDDYYGHDAPTQLHQGSANNAATDTVIDGITQSQVLSIVRQVMSTDPLNEPTTPPASDAPAFEKLAWAFAVAKNQIKTDSTTQTLFANNDSTPIGVFPVNELSGVFTRGRAT